MIAQRQPLGELTIGVVGPHDLVERVMLSGAAAGSGFPGAPMVPGMSGEPGISAGLHGIAASLGLARRLVAAAYRDEQEAADKVARLGAAVDVCLFASPVPYEYARRAGVLTSPATYVPLNGTALYAALVRASQDKRYDLARVSLDVLNRGDVEEAYAELGIATQNLHVREEPASAATVAAFHERLWRREETSVALTCVHSVAQRLTTARVPVITVRPTGNAIRSALRTAALLGGHHRLEATQLAVIVVEVPTLREALRRTTSRQAREELRLTVHRFLVQEAQRIHAAVSPMDDHCFMVTATRGSLASATDEFRVPPFIDRARAELGVVIEVGVGMGRTAQEAEAHARTALIRSRSAPSAQGFTLDREGRPLVPAPRQASTTPHAARPRGIETLARLADKLTGSDSAFVVDAEAAGHLLEVTPRTARRLLRTLVEEGLAWPLPPSRAPQPGRPRQFYRLIVEKLDYRPTR